MLFQELNREEFGLNVDYMIQAMLSVFETHDVVVTPRDLDDIGHLHADVQNQILEYIDLTVLDCVTRYCNRMVSIDFAYFGLHSGGLLM